MALESRENAAMHNPDKPASKAKAHGAQSAGGCARGKPLQQGRYRRWLGQLSIRPLSARHRPEILAHLLALRAADRYLRFGYHVSDAQIGRYVTQLNFERDALHGMFSQDMQLVAVSHLALLLHGEYPRGWLHGHGLRVAEFGVSVLATARGQGMGSRLYAHAVQGARARGMNTLIIHALSENAAMLRIVDRHGACIVKDGVDAEASLRLSPAGWVQRLEHRAQSQLTRACHNLLPRWQMGRDWLYVR